MKLNDSLNLLNKAIKAKQYYTKLKLYRKYKGLSLREVAQLTNISAPTIQRYESGKVGNPSYNVLSILANFYCISVSQLLSANKNNTFFLGGLSAKEFEVLSIHLKYMRQ